MSETVMTLEDAAARFPEVVEQVRANREAAVILRSGRPIVRIVPVSTVDDAADDMLAFLRRWRREHPEPDEQFAEAIAASRRTIQPPRDPWD